MRIICIYLINTDLFDWCNHYKWANTDNLSWWAPNFYLPFKSGTSAKIKILTIWASDSYTKEIAAPKVPPVANTSSINTIFWPGLRCPLIYN